MNTDDETEPGARAQEIGDAGRRRSARLAAVAILAESEKRPAPDAWPDAVARRMARPVRP